MRNTKRGLEIAAGQRKYLFKVLWGEEKRERERETDVKLFNNWRGGLLFGGGGGEKTVDDRQ